MSCCQPYAIKNPHYSPLPNSLNRHYFNHWKQYLKVPCGWCLNCRVDKLNWITDACDYEWKKYNYIGAFVTFTYDDIHLFDKSNIIPDDFYSFYDDNGRLHIIPFKDSRPAQYSLRRDDARDFLKRLRSKIHYLYDKHKIDNIDLCRKDFKFIHTGEYGGLFNRPHFHYVFLGLDYQFCKELFEDSWQQGIVDVRPIQDGAFRYVSDYFTKQLCGKYAKELYDDNNLERPYFTHSLGLGKGLILEQLDYIKSHNGCYLNKNDIVRPMPIYYRNLFHLRSYNLPKNFKTTEENMINHKIPVLDKPDNYSMRYSFKQMNDYKHAQALLRHRKLEIKMQDSATEYEPLICYRIGSNQNIDSLILEIFKDRLHNQSVPYHPDNFEKFSRFCDENNIIPF